MSGLVAEAEARGSLRCSVGALVCLRIIECVEEHAMPIYSRAAVPTAWDIEAYIRQGNIRPLAPHANRESYWSPLHRYHRSQRSQ